MSLKAKLALRMNNMVVRLRMRLQACLITVIPMRVMRRDSTSYVLYAIIGGRNQYRFLQLSAGHLTSRCVALQLFDVMPKQIRSMRYTDQK